MIARDTITLIVGVAAIRFGSTPHRIMARSRTQADNDARVLAMALCHDAIRDCETTAIADAFRRTPGAVLDACRTVLAKRFERPWAHARSVLASHGIDVSEHPPSPGGRAGRPSTPSAPAAPSAGSVMRVKAREPATSQASR